MFYNGKWDCIFQLKLLKFVLKYRAHTDYGSWWSARSMHPLRYVLHLPPLTKNPGYVAGLIY